jgi:putative hemolysin
MDYNLPVTETLAHLALILGLTLANGFFAGSEIGLLSVRKTRLREMAEDGNRAARVALRLRGNPERMMATVQVGITVVGTTAAVFGGATLEEPLIAYLEQAGAGTFAKGIALAAVVALVSYLTIVLGELVPKSLALRSSERFALFASRPISAVAWIARPIVWLLTTSANVVLRPFGDSTKFSETRLSPEELQQLVDEAGTVGSLDASAADIASRAIDLASLRVHAIMLPRTAIRWLRSDWSAERVLSVMRESPHARYPVHRGEGEDVAGYVLAREVFEAVVSQPELDLGRLVRQVPFLPESAGVLAATKTLQRARTEMAIVVDEQGSVSGLITIEDITEELVGPVMAEHEEARERVVREGPHRFVVDGLLPLHEASRELEIELPEEASIATVAGLVVARAGRIPAVGERVQIDERIEAEVVEATRRRVVKVRLHIAHVALDSLELDARAPQDG